AVDLGSRPIRGASGRVVEVVTWHGQSPCKASSRNVMVSASQKSGDRPRRIIMSSFGSSSDFWPLSLYRSSPSSLNSAGMCGPLGNANGFRVVKPRAGERFQPVRITPLQRSQNVPAGIAVAVEDDPLKPDLPLLSQSADRVGGLCLRLKLVRE